MAEYVHLSIQKRMYFKPPFCMTQLNYWYLKVIFLVSYHQVDTNKFVRACQKYKKKQRKKHVTPVDEVLCYFAFLSFLRGLASMQIVLTQKCVQSTQIPLPCTLTVIQKSLPESNRIIYVFMATWINREINICTRTSTDSPKNSPRPWCGGGGYKNC